MEGITTGLGRARFLSTYFQDSYEVFFHQAWCSSRCGGIICMSTHTHTHIYIYMYVFIHISIYTYIHIYICFHVHYTFEYLHIYIYVFTHIVYHPNP